MMTTTHKSPGGFYAWMMENYLNAQNRFVDLARDMYEDYCFPHEDDYDAIYDYLVYDCGAATACIAVFRECWKMYQETCIYA